VAPPRKIDWSALSLRSREIVLQCSLREAAGLSIGEVADVLNREHPEFRHLEPPPRGVYTKGWIQARLREVRREIEAGGLATY